MNAQVPIPLPVEEEAAPTLRDARVLLKRIAERSPDSLDDCDALDALCQAFLAPGPDPELEGLPPGQYRLMELFKKRLGQPVTNEMMLNAVYWDKQGEGSMDVIKQYIHRVRHKYEGRYNLDVIWGAGYRMTRVKP